MITDIINIVVAILSVITLVLVWQIYRLTRAKSIFFLMLAIAWGSVMRIAVGYFTFITETIRVTELIAGFWVIFPIGMWGLLHTLRKFYHGK